MGTIGASSFFWTFNFVLSEFCSPLKLQGCIISHLKFLTNVEWYNIYSQQYCSTLKVYYIHSNFPHLCSADSVSGCNRNLMIVYVVNDYLIGDILVELLYIYIHTLGVIHKLGYQLEERKGSQNCQRMLWMTTYVTFLTSLFFTLEHFEICMRNPLRKWISWGIYM